MSRRCCILSAIVAFMSVLTTRTCFAQNSNENNSDAADVFIIGADMSYLDQEEDCGAVYRDTGAVRDAMQILKDHGLNWVRLRLWNTPQDGYNNLDRTLAMANRVKTNDLQLLLDFHYSDTWADPGNQTKPAAWYDLSFEQLKDSLYSYTREVVSELRDQNTLPDMIQIGNEITNGMLWDDGRVNEDFDNSLHWDHFGQLLKAAIKGVKDALAAGETIPIMIHAHTGSDNTTSRWFYDHLVAEGVKFDVIGLSYYPFWQQWGGTFSNLEWNLHDLALEYDKDIIVVETASPWSMDNPDGFPNIVNDPVQTLPGYPATVDGQSRFLKRLITILKGVPHQRGKGLFYYSPEYITAPSMSSCWENVTLFDNNGELLPSVDAFIPAGLKRITIRANMAAIPEMLDPNDTVQVRGQLDGVSPVVLPDGQILAWDANTALELRNDGSDLYIGNFYLPAQSDFRFKLYAPRLEELGYGTRWEDGDSSGDQDGNTIVIVNDNVTLPLHFFTVTGQRKPYDWSLWSPKEEYVAVWLRVYMFTSNGLQQGYQPGIPAIRIGVRGDPLGGAGPLDWNSSRIWLQRESGDPDVPAYHLFSGVVYYPKSFAGKIQKYKFIVDPSGWEGGNLQGDRQLVVPSNDRSIHWVYFGDTDPIVTAVHAIPGTIEAEDFASMSGIQTEATGDTGGGINVGWLDDNDWLDYHIDAQTSGRYVVDLRIARLSSSGEADGQFRIGGETLCAFSVPPTGGWQNWRTIQTSLQLPAGRQTLRLYISKGGWNINWMKFSLNAVRR